MQRRPAMVCTALLCSAFAAGCGGPSKEEYAREANSVCKQIQEDLQSVSQGGRTTNAAEINRRTDRAVKAFASGVDRIKDLDRPSGDAGEQAEEFTEAFERFLNEDYRPGVERLQKAVSRRDRQAIRGAALRLRNIDTQDVNRLSRQLGVSECASGG